MIQNVYGNVKDLEYTVAYNNFEKNNIIGGLTLLKSKTYYEATVNEDSVIIV